MQNTYIVVCKAVFHFSNGDSIGNMSCSVKLVHTLSFTSLSLSCMYILNMYIYKIYTKFLYIFYTKSLNNHICKGQNNKNVKN